MKYVLIKESVIKERDASNWITYERTEKVEIERFMTSTGWSSIGEDRKPEDLCQSFTHPSFEYWNKRGEILKKIDDGEKIEIRKVIRQMSWENYACVEQKVVNFITLNDRRFGFTGNPSDIPSVIEFLKQDAGFKQVPLFLDHGTVILDPEATGRLISTLASMLKANNKLLTSEERGLPDITVYDDPLIPYSHVFYTFDDEGVKTRRKELIGNGQVQDYLGTLYLGHHGNGRGFYPKPDFFNVVLKPGDWKVQELMEETKNGFLVLGSTGAEIVKKGIRLKPRKVISLGGGEIMIRELAIPLAELSTLDAITSDSRLVYLDEDHGAVAPFVRIKARFLY
ncbi:MAG: metallopeptidase TldD-related protein [Metallosphaera sp.]